MSARKVLVISTLLIICLAPFQTALTSSLESNSHNETGGGPGQGPADILLMGNSYVSSNSLHNLLGGVMSEASTPANVSSLNGGGMRLSQHASNVASAGHQWNTTLNNGAWDWVVLQDQSQIPGFVRNQQEWIDSKDGAVELAEIIEDNGGKTLLMMTWGRRAGDSNNAWRFPDFSAMQDELASGYLDYRDNITANGDKAWVAPVGLAFEHIHDKIVAEGGTPTDSGNTFYDLYSGDGSHPSLSGSYLSACVLYATITGNDPVGLSHSTSLSNALVLELQQAASATVFNETSHLDYPWQTNSGGGNSGPSITIPANQTLAFDSAFAFGSSRGYEGVSDIISHNGFTYISGAYSGDINLGVGCSASSTNLQSGTGEEALTNGLSFVAKFDSNGTCIWIAPVTFNTGTGVSKPTINTDNSHKLSMDSNGNLYLVSHFTSISSTFNVNLGNLTLQTVGSYNAFLAKINPNGSYDWVKHLKSNNPFDTKCPCTVRVDSSDNIWVTSLYHVSSQFLLKYNPNGQLLNSTQINGGNVKIHATVSDANDNLYFAGQFDGTFSVTINGSSQSLTYESPGEDLLVGKMDTHGNFLWVQKAEQSSQISKIYDIAINGTDQIYLTGYFYATFELANTTLDAGGNSNGFLAKINSTGDWQWLKEMDCSCTVEMRSITADVSGNLYVGGYQMSGLVTYGNGVSNSALSGGKDAIVVKYDPNGYAQWAKSFGSNNDDQARAITLDRQGNLFVTGTFEETANIGDFQLSTTGYADIFISRLSLDYDDDQIPDVNDVDDDGDFIHDPLDSCHYSPLGFRSTGSSDHDSDGCQDDSEDNDDDNDQLNDTLDSCPKGMTGWIRTDSSDFDDDGCMDALEDYDDDNDGVEDYEDYCSRVPGNSTMEFEKGCPDTDGDSRPDILDPFPNDASEWRDTDGDDVGDNADAFPLDATQQYDTDGDTYGDEEFGNAGDSCPEIFGTSTIDRYGCIDSDGDGWSDNGDDFPNDPSEYLDTDGDNVPNHLDEFPFDPTQQTDSDGDGYGDNKYGNLGDAFPNDPTRHSDSDRDGVDDENDAFPYDPTQQTDSDGDGMGDNPMGIGADKFSNDSTQWGDIDGDGYGDNETGNNPDAFPTDATQWFDRDGDGYGDNPAGRMYDMFPDNPTQWLDEDEDGLGDNQSGTDADPYLNDFDNDGYNDTVDILPRLYSPGDLDADGCMDKVDAFINNSLECIDTDGDGIGNNADSDDDNDGWTDADEERLKTDSLNSNEKPVDSFEIQIGNIGLGAWDLIGMFGGIPIFSWILFGFVTRNARCARYEEQLEEANSRQELEQVALRWEYSLMLRLLGPHQGIRLERIRAELDDRFENAENLMLSEDFEPMTEIDQTFIVDEQEIPAIGSAPDKSMVADQIDSDGYEWIDHGGQKWYRVTNSQEEWQKFS